jgi:hypothetical protein
MCVRIKGGHVCEATEKNRICDSKKLLTTADLCVKNNLVKLHVKKEREERIVSSKWMLVVSQAAI